jgi:transcriptional regulator with XRE-family HTH domain
MKRSRVQVRIHRAAPDAGRAPRARRDYADLRAYLRATGARQEDLAAALDISQVSISRYARGTAMPHADVAERIADHCRIKVTSFAAAYYRRRKEAAA